MSGSCVLWLFAVFFAPPLRFAFARSHMPLCTAATHRLTTTMMMSSSKCVFCACVVEVLPHRARRITALQELPRGWHRSARSCAFAHKALLTRLRVQDSDEEAAAGAQDEASSSEETRRLRQVYGDPRRRTSRGSASVAKSRIAAKSGDYADDGDGDDDDDDDDDDGEARRGRRAPLPPPQRSNRNRKKVVFGEAAEEADLHELLGDDDDDDGDDGDDNGNGARKRGRSRKAGEDASSEGE